MEIQFPTFSPRFPHTLGNLGVFLPPRQRLLQCPWAVVGRGCTSVPTAVTGGVGDLTVMAGARRSGACSRRLPVSWDLTGLVREEAGAMAELPEEMGRDGAAEDLLGIGQVAERTGLAKSALHYYEEIGLIRSQRNAANQRRYPRYMIRRITLISVGRRLGIPLADIGEALARIPMDRLPDEADWQQASGEWRRILERRRRGIEELEEKLMGCIGCGCLSMSACGLLNPADELAEAGPNAQGLQLVQREGQTGGGKFDLNRT